MPFALVSLCAVGLEVAWLGGVWAATGMTPAGSSALIVVAAITGFWTLSEAIFQRRFCEKGARREGAGALEMVYGIALLAVVTACVAPPHFTVRAALARGALIALSGIALRCAAIARLGPHFHNDTGVAPGQEWNSGGIFRYLRHPSEIGVLLAAAGMALAAGSPLGMALTAFVLAPLSIHRRCREEAELRRAFPHP
ncbi:hypothetical protein BH23VER1_BH23VER1_00650 [soil metagenome]